jgi:hypothetical protein
LLTVDIDLRGGGKTGFLSIGEDGGDPRATGFLGTGGAGLPLGTVLNTSVLPLDFPGVFISIQSGSWVGVKGFEGRLGLGIELGEGALIVERAGNPNWR